MDKIRENVSYLNQNDNPVLNVEKLIPFSANGKINTAIKGHYNEYWYQLE
jgi:hypothetical protein